MKQKCEDESKHQSTQMQINPTSDQKSKANKMITVHQHKITVRGRTVLKLTAGVHSRVNGKTISETEIKETTRGNVKWKKKRLHVGLSSAAQ